jgi:hypothetical protein
LRTIGTVFRTAARLDTQEDATLNLIRLVKLPVRKLGLKDQFRQRQGVIDSISETVHS